MIGLDWRLPLDEGWALVGDRAVQGNLDPAALAAPWDVVEREAADVLARAAGRPGHVFNLGHGVLPETDPDVAHAPRRRSSTSGPRRRSPHDEPRRDPDGVRLARPARRRPRLLRRHPRRPSDPAGAPRRPRRALPRARDRRLGRRRRRSTRSPRRPAPRSRTSSGSRAHGHAPLGAADRGRGRRRARARATTLLVGLVLAPHWSSLSIAKYEELFDAAVAGRVETRFVREWGDRPGLVELLADRVRDARGETPSHVVFTAHSLPARILDDGRHRTATRCSRRRRLVADARRGRRLVVRLPERVADRRAVARARHPRLTSTTFAARGRRRRRSSARSGSSPTTSRSAGTSTSRRPSARGSSACASRGSRCRTPTPHFVRVLAGIVRRELAAVAA